MLQLNRNWWAGLGNRTALSTSVLAVLTILFNAVVFTATNATSVLISDSWYFVEYFLMPYYKSGLTLHLLLEKRSAVDHAGPVQKLILLADSNLFGLDFRTEGLFSVFIAILTLGAFGLATNKYGNTAAARSARWLAIAAVAAVYFSMNCSIVFEWPEVSLYFVAFTLVFAFFASAAAALDSGRMWLAGVATFVCLLCNDDIGLLAFASVAFMIGFSLLRKQTSTARASATFAVIVAAMLASRLIYVIFGSHFEGGGDSPAARISGLLSLGIGGLAKAVVIIASSAIVHRSHLSPGPDDGLHLIQILVALVVLTLHAWFWAAQWRMKASLLGRVALALMVFSYLLAAGILYGRVSEFGVDYLYSPRYVQLYGLGLIAIVLQLYLRVVDDSPVATAGLAKAFLLFLSVGLVCLQIPYAITAWQRTPFVAEYERNLALQIGQAADPRNTQPIQCLPQIVVCRRAYEQRRNVLEFLKNYQLNVFSPQIQRTRRLEVSERQP